MGVFYREIDEVGGKGIEKMFYAIYKKDGESHEVKLGSDRRQGMTAAKANALRTEYIQGRRQTRAEKAVTASQPENMTLADYFNGIYFPEIQARKKPSSLAREETLARLWIIPAMGKRTMKDIGLIDLEKLKKTMHTAGKAARTMVYALAVLRQVFHHAELKSPLPKGKMGSQDKRLKADNRRLRYLTPQEADLLLTELKRRSEALYEISLTSLHMGLRAGELFALAWADVDLNRGVLTLLDPKGVDSRTVYMT
ncbi:MAG: hypothetical protein Q8S17_10780, partial [Humidesulfovibrio sp.]|nr:hypothetical protein [Humidesulfovibrio sp.]